MRLKLKLSQNKLKKLFSAKKLLNAKKLWTKCKNSKIKSKKFQNLPNNHQAVTKNSQTILIKVMMLPLPPRSKRPLISTQRAAKKRKKRRKKRRPWTQMSSLDKTLKSRSKSANLLKSKRNSANSKRKRSVSETKKKNSEPRWKRNF
jgi:hypothetical protein